MGVVANIKNASLVRDPEPAIYFTYRQFPFRGLHIVVQGVGDPAQLVAAVRTAVVRLDPNLPLASARTLQQVLGDATDRPRALMLLMAVFAVASGVYFAERQQFYFAYALPPLVAASIFFLFRSARAVAVAALVVVLLAANVTGRPGMPS